MSAYRAARFAVIARSAIVMLRKPGPETSTSLISSSPVTPKVQAGFPADATPKELPAEIKTAQRSFFALLYHLLVGRDTGPRRPPCCSRWARSGYGGCSGTDRHSAAHEDGAPGGTPGAPSSCCLLVRVLVRVRVESLTSPSAFPAPGQGTFCAVASPPTPASSVKPLPRPRTPPTSCVARTMPLRTSVGAEAGSDGGGRATGVLWLTSHCLCMREKV
ncbi:hypothetical protein SHIRM173S_00187 [Streptomyces hirsutus]